MKAKQSLGLALATLFMTLAFSGTASAQTTPPPGTVLDANTLGLTADAGSQPIGFDPFDPTVNGSWAQTFTAESSGKVAAVEVQAARGTDGSSPLLVRLLALNGSGAPTEANVLASAEIPASEVPENTDGRVRAFFPTPPTVAAGTGYAIALSTAQDTYYGWALSTTSSAPGPYGGGGPFYKRNDGPWDAVFPQIDAIFGVYMVDPNNTAPVISPISPRPGSMTLDRTPTIRATVRDDSGDLTPSRIRLSVDGKPRSFSYTAGTLDRLTRTLPLAPGRHTVSVSSTDPFGESATRSWSFTIKKRR